jgi:hypothetical protein
MSGQPTAFFDASYPYETFFGAMIMAVDWIERIKWRETVSLRGSGSHSHYMRLGYKVADRRY